MMGEQVHTSLDCFVANFWDTFQQRYPAFHCREGYYQQLKARGPDAATGSRRAAKAAEATEEEAAAATAAAGGQQKTAPASPEVDILGSPVQPVKRTFQVSLYCFTACLYTALLCSCLLCFCSCSLHRFVLHLCAGVAVREQRACIESKRCSTTAKPLGIVVYTARTFRGYRTGHQCQQLLQALQCIHCRPISRCQAAEGCRGQPQGCTQQAWHFFAPGQIEGQYPDKPLSDCQWQYSR